MKDFLDIDDKIEENKSMLEFYYSNYQKTQSKVTILTIIYSVLSIYIVQIIKYPFEQFHAIGLLHLLTYLLILCIFISFLIWSIRFTYLLLNPMHVAYLNEPKYFYEELRIRYEKELDTTNPAVLNAYIKTSYLRELEMVVERTFTLLENKGNYYDTAFKKGLVALFLYLTCAGFIILEPDKPDEINIKNFKEIINSIDSNYCKIINPRIMSEENENNDSEAGSETDSSSTEEEITVDPDKVITTEPRMILENFSKEPAEETKEETTEESSEEKSAGSSEDEVKQDEEE